MITVMDKRFPSIPKTKMIGGVNNLVSHLFLNSSRSVHDGFFFLSEIRKPIHVVQQDQFNTFFFFFLSAGQAVNRPGLRLN